MPADYPQRGEVWIVRFPMSASGGVEYKKRPAVVLSIASPHDTAGIVTVVPTSTRTTPRTKFDILVERNTGIFRAMGLRSESVILCAHLYSPALSALTERIGRANPDTMAKIEDNLRALLFAKSSR